ncbi:MAG: TerB family tellurite resistance protein [Cyanobacteria bacterium SBLK]|nr:TerB family tellurite resistance protein [Cyanobacteria bacterium SBLK]
MNSGKILQPTQYAKHKYNITKPIDFEVAVNYAGALMAIAGADGELAEEELQWYIEEQELLFTDPTEYIEEIRSFHWKNVNIKELLGKIKYDFPINFRRAMLYQAIKMSRADGIYEDREKIAVSKAAEILGIQHSIVVSIESLVELEDTSDRLRLALLETAV